MQHNPNMMLHGCVVVPVHISCPEVMRGTTWCSFRCILDILFWSFLIYFVLWHFFGQFKVQKQVLLARGFSENWGRSDTKWHPQTSPIVLVCVSHFLPLSPGTIAVFQLFAVLIFTGLTKPWPNSLQISFGFSQLHVEFRVTDCMLADHCLTMRPLHFRCSADGATFDFCTDFAPEPKAQPLNLSSKTR